MKTIPLTQGLVALVDDEDFDRINVFNWYANRSRNTFYAVRMSSRLLGRRKVISMHREILFFQGEDRVDHRNGNGLDNRKENLRRASHQENGQNSRKPAGPTSSRFKGVHWDKRKNLWMARIRVGGKQKFLGYFAREVEAAKIYDAAAQKHYGEFSRPNFI